MAGERVSRREFLKVDGLKEIFGRRDPLDRAGYILQNRFNRFPGNRLHLVNSGVLKPRERPAFHSPKPEAQGVVTVTNDLPTLKTGEDIIHAVGQFSKKVVSPIVFGLTGGYAGFNLGVERARKSSKGIGIHPTSVSDSKDKQIKKAKYTRREAMFGIGGGATGFALSEGLLACGALSPDGPNFTNYDSTDYQRTTLVGHPLSKTVSSPDNQRAPHAVELIAELQRAVQIVKPDVSLYRTLVDYNDTKNKKTGSEFEMAFVKIGTQADHVLVNGKEQILDEDVYLVSYIGPDGKPIARVAIWSEIPDQAGAKAFGLHLADTNLLPNFKKPLLEYIKKDGEDKVKVGFFDTQTYQLKDTASFTLNGSEDFSLSNALSILFNPFAVPPVEAAEITPIPPTATTIPTVISTATATTILEPPFVSPTETASTVPEQTILTADQMKELGLEGDGIRIQTTYMGVPIDATVVASPSILKYLPHGKGFSLNPNLAEIGDKIPADQRLAEMILLGHYRGYFSDHFIPNVENLKGEKQVFDKATYDKYPFEQYLADLNSGKDMSYRIWGVSTETGNSGPLRVDPRQPVTYVVTSEIKNPNGNAYLYMTNDYRTGFYVNKSGQLKLIALPGYSNILSDPNLIPTFASIDTYFFWMLGWSENIQRSGVQFNTTYENDDYIMQSTDKIFYQPISGQKGSSPKTVLFIERTK